MTTEPSTEFRDVDATLTALAFAQRDGDTNLKFTLEVSSDDINAAVLGSRLTKGVVLSLGWGPAFNSRPRGGKPHLFQDAAGPAAETPAAPPPPPLAEMEESNIGVNCTTKKKGTCHSHRSASGERWHCKDYAGKTFLTACTHVSTDAAPNETADVICPDCQGSGLVAGDSMCPRCQGVGHGPVVEINRSPTVTCPRCNGDGILLIGTNPEDAIAQECTMCHGEKAVSPTILCTACKGYGGVPTHDQLAGGEVSEPYEAECSQCKGSGLAERDVVDQALDHLESVGAIEKRQVIGVTKCKTCEGTGIGAAIEGAGASSPCKDCNGEGEIVQYADEPQPACSKPIGAAGRTCELKPEHEGICYASPVALETIAAPATPAQTESGLNFLETDDKKCMYSWYSKVGACRDTGQDKLQQPCTHIRAMMTVVEPPRVPVAAGAEPDDIPF